MMVRVSEWTFFDVNLGGIAEAMAFVPWWGKGFFCCLNLPRGFGRAAGHLPLKIT